MASSNLLAREQKKPAVNKLSRDNRMREKAQTLFYVYYQMGADRSLFKLFEICGTIGVKISERSIENYSRKYEWQRQILELDNKVAESREVKVLEEVEAMNSRHAMLGQALTSIAGSELQKFAEGRKNSKLPLGVYEITQLFKSGQFGERLARGQATSRTDVMVELIGTFVKEFAMIFLSVNDIGPEEGRAQRKMEYVRRCDEMLREIYPQAQKGTLRLGDGY